MVVDKVVEMPQVTAEDIEKFLEVWYDLAGGKSDPRLAVGRVEAWLEALVRLEPR